MADGRFAVENVAKTFSLLEEQEKQGIVFSREEKGILYRLALYTEPFEEIKEKIRQAADAGMDAGARSALLEQYAQALPPLPGDAAAQMESCIFQVQQMCYEREKACRMLEDILEKNGIHKETGKTSKRNGQPVKEERRKTAGSKRAR